MEGQKSRNVNVGESISVGHYETLFANLVLDPLDPSSGHGGWTCVGDRDLPPCLVVVAVVGNFGWLAQTDGEVVHAAFVVEEEVLDYVTSVASAHH
ncbi:uncharacterized protein METZ01_LOCUS407195, partial [marine metagenome]